MSGELDELRTLTVKGAAELTGIQVWRIYELIAANEGPPHFRLGRTIRFRVPDVKNWLEEQTAKQQ